MPDTLLGPCAVVSCHVERLFDDAAWSRFVALQTRRPGGFSMAALVRPADPAFGEDEAEWAARARDAAARGPLGHHTHWTAPEHARPSSHGAGARVIAEGRRLRDLGLRVTHFCGGGWYTDAEVAEACAELGYVDCTPRAKRPPYLGDDERWAMLAQPARILLPSGRSLAAVPTTHSLGDLARALLSRSLPHVVHVYFHDSDLLDRRRRALVTALLRVLARRRRPVDLETLSKEVIRGTSTTPWAEVARGSA
ncbi:MAG TPA: hypothetical protein VMN35_02995 [Gaiellaceae bacterium]|nr:hypothetical protein [Gaiellaceae bacterium]